MRPWLGRRGVTERFRTSHHSLLDEGRLHCPVRICWSTLSFRTEDLVPDDILPDLLLVRSHVRGMVAVSEVSGGAQVAAGEVLPFARQVGASRRDGLVGAAAKESVDGNLLSIAWRVTTVSGMDGTTFSQGSTKAAAETVGRAFPSWVSVNCLLVGLCRVSQ